MALVEIPKPFGPRNYGQRLTIPPGAGAAAVPLDELEIPSPAVSDDQLLVVNEALEKFAALDARSS